jgi:clan AA aspartic protease
VGTTYAEITLKNATDVGFFDRGHMAEKDVRQITVQALVDTGALRLVINEELREKLGLNIKSQNASVLADGSSHVYGRTEPIELHWKDRDCYCSAVVVPHAKSTLLGAIPLEAMDLMVNPTTRELVGVHGEHALELIM